MSKIHVFILTGVIALLTCCSGDSGQYESRAEKIVAEIHTPSSDYVLVVSHRGDWRNYPENSIPAIESAIRMGVDIIELDIQLTRDSVLVLSHDSTINRCTNGKGRVGDYTYAELMQFRLKRAHGVTTDSLRMCTLREALECCKDRVVVNVDKGYEYYSLVLEIAEELGVFDQVLIKGKKIGEEVETMMASHENSLIYMPVVNILEPQGKILFEDYLAGDVVPPAVELCWDRMTPEVEAAIEGIHSKGSKLWVNTIWGSLCGYLDDDAAFSCEDPAEVYDKVIALGATMIQTDRPEMLLEYLRSKGLHD